jgi:hypothetical protein
MDHGMKARKRFHHKNRNASLSETIPRKMVRITEYNDKSTSNQVDLVENTSFMYLINL